MSAAGSLELSKINQAGIEKQTRYQPSAQSLVGAGYLSTTLVQDVS